MISQQSLIANRCITKDFKNQSRLSGRKVRVNNVIECKANRGNKTASLATVKSVPKQSYVEAMKVNSWAPELINGRCAMLGYVAGYGYEAFNHESFREQSLDYWPAFVITAIMVTFATLKTGKPTKEDVKVNGLTPEAELFNGRAAMIGIASTLLYEFMSK